MHGTASQKSVVHDTYALAKENNGTPGVDGMTFEDIEARGAEAFLMQVREQLTLGT